MSVTVDNMQAPRVQLCLLSGPQAGSLLPLLDSRTRPTRVLVLAAAGAETALEAFCRLVQAETGLAVQTCVLAERADAADIVTALEGLLAGCVAADVVLNVSGGTRLMGLAAQGVGQRLGLPVWFVDARYGGLQVLAGPLTYQGMVPASLTLPQVLALQGWQWQAQTVFMPPAAWQVLIREWIANLRHYSTGLAILDWLALSAGAGLVSRELEPWQFEVQAFRDVIQRLRQLDLVQLEGRRMVFTDEQARLFARGGWLQGYVLSCLAALEIGATQAGASVRVCDDRGRQHELDVAFVVANRLHVIGCRSVSVRKGRATTDMEVIFSPSLLQSGLPLTGGGLLLAYRPLKSQEVSRLRMAGVDVLQEKQLQNLSTYLQEGLLHQV